MTTQLDSILTQLGTGAWSVLHIATLGYFFSVPAYQSLLGAFTAPRQPHHCLAWDPASPALPNHTTANGSCTREWQDEDTGESEESKCQAWEFSNSTFTSTVTSEFGLACDHEYLRALFTSIYMFGVFFGAPLNGVLADKYGRKPLVVVGAVAYVGLAIITTWLPSLSALLGARFLLGLLQANIANTGYILAVENAEPRLRTILGITLFIPWALGEMVLGGLAYLIRDWRHLQLATSLMGVVFIPAFWFLDESPRWLAVVGRHGEALRVLRRAARLNKTQLPPEDHLLAVLNTELPVSKGVVERRGFRATLREAYHSSIILFRTPRLRLITAAMYLNYMVVSMVYYGLSLSGANLSSDPFLYMVLSGFMEIPAYLLAYPLVAKGGRRWPTVLSFLASGIGLFVLALVPKDSSVVFGLALFGKLTITIAYQIVIFWSSELFPTEVRSRGIGTCFMMSRVGSISSPFITEFLGAVYPWGPSVLFAGASLVVGLVSLCLPETMGVALPDTIAQLEDQSREFKRGFMRLPLRRDTK